MKIAHVVCTYPPYKGGMGNVVCQFACLTAKAGHTVTVYTPEYKYVAVADESEGAITESIDVIRLTPWLAYGNGAFLPQLVWRLRGFDIVHLHYPFFGSAEMVWLARMLLNRRMKFIIHYHMDVYGLPWYAEVLRWPSKLLCGHLLKAAERITCASFDYMESSDISGYYQTNSGKFTDIPFGVDTDKFRPADKGASRIILFVGSLDRAHYFKGVDVLLKAVAECRISNFECYIAGDGEMREGYERTARRLGIHKRVNFVGSPDDSGLIRYYQQADAVVLPSVNRNEAFGLVLLEAMACGTPVIASALPGVRNVFRDGAEGFLTVPGDVGDLSKKIGEILNDDIKRQEMGRAARMMVEDKYSLDRVGERLNGVYGEVSRLF